MNTLPFARTLIFSLVASLTACGGGGGGAGSANISSGDSGGGLGEGTTESTGSGATSSGTIDGFGSIFVNGVEFETDDAVIIVDGEQVGEDQLGLGMVVLVTGTINEDGTTGTAINVVFDEDVEGPVSALVRDMDGDSMEVTVLGVAVIVERTGTVFEGVSFDTLLPGDQVIVSGFETMGGSLRATRLERVGVFVAGVSEVELAGIISELTSTTFMLGDALVDYSSADLIDIADDVLEEGMEVEVEGTLTDDVINAEKVEREGDVDDDFEEEEDVFVQGTITDFVSNSDFRVNGVGVNAGDAELFPVGLVLADGAIVEVEGYWDGEVLRAEAVEIRRGRVEIEAVVGSVDTGAGTITLQLAGGSVVVQLDSRTLLEDDTDIADPMRIEDVRSGDFLKVEAIASGQTLLATRVDRGDADDDVLQAPVQSFIAGSSVTMLGITFSTAGADFENQDDLSVSAEAFYSVLEEGMLVKIKDEETPDGVADEVEFESDEDLDGEPEHEEEEHEEECDDEEECEEEEEHEEECDDEVECEEEEEHEEECDDEVECEEEEEHEEECDDEEECEEEEEHEEECGDVEECEEEEPED